MSTPNLFAGLEGRRACVTGSSSGIGRAIAVELARAGADVVVHCGHRLPAAEETLQLVQQLGRRGWTLQQDLSQLTETAAAELIDRLWSEFGPLDIWVNNAGADILTGTGRSEPFSEKLGRLWSVDVRAALLLARAVGLRMRDSGCGVILNIGWDQADRGMEGDSGELFCAVKNAVMGMTRSLALSLAPQVRVNCIAPGWIRTSWGESAGPVWQERVQRETPLGRWGTPEDIARLARFLVSDDAGYITGQVINANGGAVR